MNTHKHARLTFLRRLEMVQQLIAHQVCVPEAARAYGVTAPTVRKWLGRFLAQGQAGLADASSRPTVSPRAIAPAKALAIVELRRKRLTQARIAQALGVSASTVSRVLARAGLSHLADLEPAEPVVRYEHQAPGDLLHIDIKKLGRIQRPGHRVTGNRRDTVEGAGWDFVFVAIDDHARVAFTDIPPDERLPSAVQFLKDAVAYYQRLGVTIQRLLTDNGSAFRSRAFAALCHELGIKHRFTRPYRPQTNGKAERFIQSALREWAYAHTYQNSQHRADAMKSWLHHYNWHRPHQGIGRAVPISRLNLDEYNLLTVHSYWTLTALDVGQGGAVVLETARHVLLFDTGPRHGDASDAGERVIAPFLWARGYRHIDTLVVSHADLDHTGGLRSVLAALPVGQAYASFDLAAWLARQARVRPDGWRAAPRMPPATRGCEAGVQWRVDGVRLRFVYPPSLAAPLPWRSSNARSCVLLVEGVGHRALLTGDVGLVQEAAFAAALPPVDLVMAPHHGSAMSSGSLLTAATRPAHAIAQAGYLNRFGHPAASAINRWRRAGAAVWRTDLDGAVRADSTPRGLFASGQRQVARRYWRDSRAGPDAPLR
ncbi:transposase, IS481 family [Bordetella pertussis STO1-SEAT-0006]|uniref:IS481 family transposase n=1 Tax=Bordetella pertussis TaxID=520 RepID=UPI0003D3C6BD|nr:transposase, IS481 family [Bordetella pertussis STO1-SEAT-0006]